jgi:hypothetical protein
MIHFPDINYLLYISESKYHRSLKHYYTYVNDETHTKALSFTLPLLEECINYYNKFVNQDSPITKDSTMESILSALLKNVDVIALVICKSEVTSLLFKTNKSSGYVDDKLDQQFNMKFTPKTVTLSLNIEKNKQNLQKQIDDFNVLISKDLLFIKDKQKEVKNNRNELKRLKCKLDKCVQKDPFILSNNSSSSSSTSSSSSSLLDDLPQNWTEEQMQQFITEKIIQDKTSVLITMKI